MLFTKSAEIKRMHRLIGAYVDNDTENKVSDDHDGNNRLWDYLLNSSAETFKFAGLSQAEQKKVISRDLLAFAIIIAIAFLLKNPFLLSAIFIVLLIEKRHLVGKAKKRARSFEKDYTALLLSLASGVKTGLDPLAALSKSYLLFQKDSVLRHETERLNKNIEAGDSEEEVLRKFGDSINHPDLKLFRTAFILARKEGSSLSHCLHRLTKVTRQRQSFRRKTRSAVAMQRLSAFGIAACAIIIGIIQSLTNAEAIQLALAHPIGSKLLFLGIGLIAAGVGWMLHMTKSRV